jgi:hypothetical protein
MRKDVRKNLGLSTVNIWNKICMTEINYMLDKLYILQTFIEYCQDN